MLHYQNKNFTGEFCSLLERDSALCSIYFSKECKTGV